MKYKGLWGYGARYGLTEEEAKKLKSSRKKSGKEATAIEYKSRKWKVIWVK